LISKAFGGLVQIANIADLKEAYRVIKFSHRRAVGIRGISYSHPAYFTVDAIRVDLFDGRTITVPLAWYPRLLHATPEERENWKIAGAGYGIHWPDIDEDLSTQGLLQGAPAPRKASKSE